MKPASFVYHAPTTVTEVVALLAEHADEAKVLAGGQSLVPILALRLARFEHLVDLNKVHDLDGVHSDSDAVVVGAMTRQAHIEHSAEYEQNLPLLRRAIPYIGHFQIRNRGTIGGSLCHADPASEIPAVTTAMRATIEVAGPSARRSIAAREFFTSVWQTALEPDEIVVAIRFPTRTKQCGFAIEELAWRLGDFAIAGVAVSVSLDDQDRIEQAGISFMGMGPTPICATDAEAALIGTQPSELNLSEIATLAVSATDPNDDVHASGAYRKKVAEPLCARALAAALKEAVNE